MKQMNLKKLLVGTVLPATLMLSLLLSACGGDSDPVETEDPTPTETVEPEETEIPEETEDPIPEITFPPVEIGEFSYEGTMLNYEGYEIDVANDYPEVTEILSCTPVDGKLVLECAADDGDTIYCFFSVENMYFNTMFRGENLIWRDDDLDTAYYSRENVVYSAWSIMEVVRFGMPEDCQVSALAFSEDGTQLIVTLQNSDGTEEVHEIDVEN